MVGTNGRYVHQKLYKKQRPGHQPLRLALPFALANTKLFRRELVEKHGLRFPEDLPVGSDQPFTIEACVRARKISVLADYTFYYAVKRGDASNITYRADHLSRLRCTARDHEARGLARRARARDRDALFKRHFTWELAKLVQDDFPALDAETRRRGAARASPHLADDVPHRRAPGLPGRQAPGADLPRAGAVPSTSWSRAITEEAEHGAPPFHLEDGRAFAAYPGFRDEALGLPDRVYELVGEAVPGRLAKRHEARRRGVGPGGDDLHPGAHGPGRCPR